MSSSNCCFLTCIQISQEAGQVVWYSYLFQNFPEFVVVHTVKGFGIVNKAEVDGFLELSYFFHDPVDVYNLISVSSAFSKSSFNGSCIVEAWLWEFWALLYLCVRWVHLFGSLRIFWHCLSLGLEWKVTFSSPVATANLQRPFYSQVQWGSFHSWSVRFILSLAGIDWNWGGGVKLLYSLHISVSFLIFNFS